MAIIGSFNGASIVAMPAFPAPQSIDFTAQDIVAVSTSPFSGKQQVQDWGASWLEASVTMPPMTHNQAQAWIAFLLQLRGQACLFQLGDPLALAPGGTAAGSPLVNGSAQSGYVLSTRGWTPNATNVLRPGDWLQVGYRLYRNLDPVSADGSGVASLRIWPQLRESPADGAALLLNNTMGLWRLNSNQRKWSITEARNYGFSFTIREAI